MRKFRVEFDRGAEGLLSVYVYALAPKDARIVAVLTAVTSSPRFEGSLEMAPTRYFDAASDGNFSHGQIVEHGLQEHQT